MGIMQHSNYPFFFMVDFSRVSVSYEFIRMYMCHPFHISYQKNINQAKNLEELSIFTGLAVF